MVLGALSRKPMIIFLIQYKELLKEIKQLELQINLAGIETVDGFAIQPSLIKSFKKLRMIILSCKNLEER